MKTISIALVTVMVAAGCASPRPMSAPGPRITANDDPSNRCFQAQDSDPRFAALKAHTALSRSTDAILPMLADPAKPTEAERAVLLAWAEDRVACASAGRSFRSSYFPAVVPAYEKAQLMVNQSLADLYAGKITYGEFNKTRQRITIETREEMMQALRQASNDAFSRQIAIEAASRASIAQQQQADLLRAMKAPTTCTTSRMGFTTQTECR